MKEKYQGTLVTNLYFNSLDNNQGVIHHLIDQAEEEECKEALLAYHFLLTEPEAGRDEATLDARIERFLHVVVRPVADRILRGGVTSRQSPVFRWWWFSIGT